MNKIPILTRFSLIVHISNSIEPTNFVLQTNTQQHNVQGQGHNFRSKVTDVEVSAFSECFLFNVKDVNV